jgi:hypothetical protein
VAGETGFLATSSDVAPLGDALEDLWQSRASLESMGRAAFLHVNALLGDQPEFAFARRLHEFIEPKRTRIDFDT